MRLLLDTHAFVWAISDDVRLPGRTRSLLQDEATEVWVSLVSLWELAIKTGLGRFSLPVDLLAFFRRQLRLTGFEMLGIEPEHVVAVRDLPLHHRDPFDRLLIAQSHIEGLALVSRDRLFAAYAVNLVW